MLRLATDADVPYAIIRGVRCHAPGIDLVHSLDLLPEGTPDPDVLAWAAAEKRVLITNDRATMIGFANRRVAAGEPLPGLYHVPVHTIVILLRPQAAHSNMNGMLDYAARPEHGSMSFRYQVERLWERSAEDLLAGDVGVAPLAMLGRLPPEMSKENGLAAVAHRLVERLIDEAAPERARKLLTDALLLTGLRVKRRSRENFSRSANDGRIRHLPDDH